jgi:hypothetical protein
MRRNPSALRFGLVLTGLVAVWAGAAQARQSSVAVELECKTGLAAANKELEAARLKSPAGSVYVTKAATLLGAAKVQQEFGKYPNCVNKVKRARIHLRRAAAAG